VIVVPTKNVSPEGFVEMFRTAGLLLSEQQLQTLPGVYEKMHAAMATLRRPGRAPDAPMAVALKLPHRLQE
jgi:hypothetical protein